MGYLINDNLIWVMTPKSASYSIESALFNSNLKLKKYNEFFNKNKHIHKSLNDCLEYFGNKESVCITRNWFDRWMSSLNFIWDIIEYGTPFEPICKWENLDNNTIYKMFDIEFINTLHSESENDYEKAFLSFLKNKEEDIFKLKNADEVLTIVGTLISEKFWKSNKKCTYEFDITELDKFVDFIENRFGERLVLEQINKSTKRLNKIIINDELKSFVWEKFEKPFEKRNHLI